MIKCVNSINAHFKNPAVNYTLEELIEHFQVIFKDTFTSMQSGELQLIDQKVLNLLAYFDKTRSLDAVQHDTLMINASIIFTPQGVMDKVAIIVGTPMELWVYNHLIGKSDNLIIHDWDGTLIVVDVRTKSKGVSTYLTVGVAKNMISEIHLSPSTFFPQAKANIVLTGSAHKSLKELAMSVARLSAVAPRTLINDVSRISAIEIWTEYAGDVIKFIDVFMTDAYTRGLWQITSYSEEGSGAKRAFRNLIEYQENPESICKLSAREFNEIANVQVLLGILGVELLNLTDKDFYHDPNKRFIQAIPVDSLKELEQAVDSKPKPIYS